MGLPYICQPFSLRHLACSSVRVFELMIGLLGINPVAQIGAPGIRAAHGAARCDIEALPISAFRVREVASQVAQENGYILPMVIIQAQIPSGLAGN